ncbi:hypothetical protein ACJMK2_015540 [Sinanodonta woodiana]|uniref:Uncharacterized protein n=1 Tax=Sinanodonta woodiana TaxID=1069815 RepID=A0ABD3UUI7_SINWO
MLRFSILIFAVLGTAWGCSPPEGGYVEPTAAEIVFYADYVAIGRVTQIITPDPVYGDIHSSIYGAELLLSCQYKGGNMPKIITVSGAGFIPGHCTTKDLNYNTEYILFLSKRDNGYFEQTSTAHNATELDKFLKVCKLALKYPIGITPDVLKVQCQAPKTSSDCESYDPSASTPVPTSPFPEPVVSVSPEHVLHVEKAQGPKKEAEQKGPITTTPASGSGATNHYVFLLACVVTMHQAFVLL